MHWVLAFIYITHQYCIITIHNFKKNIQKNATVLCFLQDFYKKSAPPQPVLNKLTAGGTGCIICNMKKVFIGFIFISILTVAGCGVKSDLARPDPSFPRNYPVY